MLVSQIKRKDRINFSIVSIEIMPPIKDGFVVSILPIEDAMIREPNLMAINSSICSNTNKEITDINNDDFFLIRKESGEQIIIASSWIVEDTITSSQDKKTLILTITDIKVEDIQYYKTLIESKGHSYNARIN